MSKEKEKPKSRAEEERDRMFMKDKQGRPLNEAVRAKNPGKYGALGQH